jgi:hypothetical protein
MTMRAYFFVECRNRHQKNEIAKLVPSRPAVPLGCRNDYIIYVPCLPARDARRGDIGRLAQPHRHSVWRLAVVKIILRALTVFARAALVT